LMPLNPLGALPGESLLRACHAQRP
jgi:hypothetical protein